MRHLIASQRDQGNMDPLTTSSATKYHDDWNTWIHNYTKIRAQERKEQAKILLEKGEEKF